MRKNIRIILFLLRWGVELSLPLSQKKVGDCTIHNVNDGDLVACFDGKITETVIDEIAAMKPFLCVWYSVTAALRRLQKK